MQESASATSEHRSTNNNSSVGPNRLTRHRIYQHVPTTRLDERPAPGRLSRFLTRLPGHELSAASVSFVCLLSALAATGEPLTLALEMSAIVMAARIVVMLIRNLWSVAVLSTRRLHARQVWRDELFVGVAFPAAAFLLRWDVGPFSALIFLGLNIAAQFALFGLSKSIFKFKAGDHTRTARQCAIILGSGPVARRVVDALLDHPELDTRPIGFLDYHRTGLWRYRDIPLIGHPDRLTDLVMGGQVDVLFLAVESKDIAVASGLVEAAERMGVPICLMPGLLQTRIAMAEIARLNGFPTLLFQTVRHDYASLVLKQTVDFLGALTICVLAAPIMLLTVIAIKLDSKGPILFKQERSGRNGRRFTLLKFRTMTCDAEKQKASLLKRNEMSGPVFKIKDDPRVTRVGKYLRKYSIDELPQLFNVLAGEMSLVGPRPPLPSEVIKFESWQRRKLSVRPGLTCLWQVNGRNAIDFTDWMRLDLEYIDNWSLWLDAKILVKTIPAVLRGSGV